MIRYHDKDKTFYLETNQTSYIFRINEYNHVEHIYYGSKISPLENIDQLISKYQFELGSATSYKKEAKGYMLNHTLLEISTFGKGDYREPTLHIELPNGSRTLDFTYQSHQIINKPKVNNMPQTKKQETLEIKLSSHHIDVYLYYTVYQEDCIVRNIEIVNHNKEEITIDKALSCNLDMQNNDYVLSKLDGAWIRERHVTDTFLTKGTVHFDSKKGVSSSDHNPFFMIKQKDTKEDYGKAYGFALIYSGNFEANVEVSPHDLLRMNIGINSFDFRYGLKQEERFITPEVILTFSDKGLNQLSNNFHNLINHYLIQENDQSKERPILVNNWEATYFDFNKKKLLAIAKKASKLGIELFCLDDGWFGRRNDDFSSLGDWQVNKKKIPGGIEKLSKKINKLGLDFGIWVEPEMVNKDSVLYQKHPDWAIEIPKEHPSLGRNQLILDLTNKDVVEYLKQDLTRLFKQGNIKYVKWDMNRNFSDVFSQHLKKTDQGKFNHLYVLGLYELLDHLKQTFPDILFESCSSGGNRFDLGMLYYMPQTWTSDNTDAYERLLIQEGTSYCYPLSSISNHVSGHISHQTLRFTPLESRFNVSSFGVLGYELDLSKLTRFDEKVIKKQIEYYKKHRSLFQFGSFQRISSVRNSNESIWLLQNKEKDEGMLLYMQDKARPNPPLKKIPLKGFKEGMYIIQSREQYMNVRRVGTLLNHILPVKLKMNGLLHTIIANNYLYKEDTLYKEMTSDQLEHFELSLHSSFTGTGANEKVMLLPDYGSKLFNIKRRNE